MTDEATPREVGCNEGLGAGSEARPSFDVLGFRGAVDRSRAARGLLWKHVAKQTGVSTSTLSRMKDGRRPDAASLAALSACAGINPANYRAQPAPPARFSAGGAGQRDQGNGEG